MAKPALPSAAKIPDIHLERNKQNVNGSLKWGSGHDFANCFILNENIANDITN